MLGGSAPRVASAVALGAAVLAAPACSVQVTGPALVLHLASPDKPTDETAAPIRQFADEVDRRSSGTIRIEPVWDVAPGYVHDWDQVTARTVMDGTYELGFVPGRAFDKLGVDTLRALNTPFLITSEPALETVLNSDLREPLLAGLSDAGLVGLDIIPDALRHPFGYDQPLDDADSYVGTLVRTPSSETVSRLFETLGAHVSDAEPASAVGGAEAGFSVAPAGVGYATGNVTFFPKTNVLVADAEVRDRLRADQWEVLLDAAGAVRDWQFSQQQSDFEAAAVFCDRGGEIVAASADQVASLRPAADQVTAWLRRDATTRQLIDAITRATHELPDATPITECPGASDAQTGEDTESSQGLDGQYRARVTRRDLVRAGVTNETAIRENTGIVTWTLDDGTWSYHQTADHYLSNPDDTGRFTYEDDRLVLYWNEPGDVTEMTVDVGWDGTLRFSDIREGLPGNQALGEGYFGAPWRRLGDVPAD